MILCCGETGAALQAIQRNSRRHRVCNEKRRASQPLNQKSAGCIFKNPPGGSAGRMIDELGLKGFRVGDARVSDRHANFFVNAGKRQLRGHAAADRARCASACAPTYGIELENEVILWTKLRAMNAGSLSPGSSGRRRAAVSPPAKAGGDPPAQIRPQGLDRHISASLWMLAALGCASACVGITGHTFFVFSPRMALIHPDQVEIAGNHYVEPRQRLLEVFAADLGQSVLRIPLEERRRRQLEAIPWVEQATVRARATEPALQWKSPSARPSHSCAAAAACSWWTSRRDSGSAARERFPFSRGDGA